MQSSKAFCSFSNNWAGNLPMPLPLILILFSQKSQSYCDSDPKHNFCQQSSLKSTQTHGHDRPFSSRGGWSSECEAGGSRSTHSCCPPIINFAGGQKHNVSCSRYDFTGLPSRCRARTEEPEKVCRETKAGTGGASGRPVVADELCNVHCNSAS